MSRLLTRALAVALHVAAWALLLFVAISADGWLDIVQSVAGARLLISSPRELIDITCYYTRKRS